ncbi:MAG: hypothetical protein Q4D38_13440 [Planctomycetia bacterium]|nr:hypothetical protein [Planctomycetia bacterium]
MLVLFVGCSGPNSLDAPESLSKARADSFEESSAQRPLEASESSFLSGTTPEETADATASDTFLPTQAAVVVAAAQNPVPGAKDFAMGRLVAHGWRLSAAEAVCDLNDELFESLYSLGEDENGQNPLESVLRKLYRLGRPEFQDALEERPEMASLFALVLDYDDASVMRIIQTIPLKDEEYVTLVNIYMVYSDAEEIVKITRLLQKSQWRESIFRLCERSPQGYEMLKHLQFLETLLEESESAGKVYQEWLFSIFDRLLELPVESEEAVEMATFLDTHAQLFREMLVEEPEFQNHFIGCWERFQNTLRELDSTRESDRDLRALYTDHPDVIPFLYRYRDYSPEELLRRYGVYAFELLLYSPFSNNAKALEKLLSVMLDTNEEEAQLICQANLPELPNFARLLERDLPSRAYCQMCSQLIVANSSESGLSPNQRIVYWDSLSDDVLVNKELTNDDGGILKHIPLYTISSKLLTGREVTGMDYAMAAVDAGFLIVDVATLGGGTVVTTSGRAVLKGGASAGARAIAKETAKNSAKVVARELTQEAMKKALKTGVGTCDSMMFLRSVQRHFATKFGRSVFREPIDITKYVQYLFKKTNMGAKVFKNVTGLEARCFMRGDRRVLLHLDRIPKTRIGGLIIGCLNDFALSLGMEMASDSLASQKFMENAVENVVENVEERAEDVHQTWKKHASTWWVLNMMEKTVLE